MMRELCLILFVVVISVSSNPLGQLIPSCNACQPTSYTNPTVPVLIQTSNTSPCAQSSTVQIPTTFPAPLGDTLNQIILSRVLTNPSLQKIIDPNTRLFNQNGNEVNRQVSNAGTPNVINNYFIVPPEFFNITEAGVKGGEEVKVDVDVKKPRRKTQRKGKIDSDIVIPAKTKASPVNRRKQKGTSSSSRKNKRVRNSKDVAIVDDLDKSEEVHTKKERERNKRRHKDDKYEQTVIPPLIEDSSEYLENVNVINRARKSTKSKNRNIKQKPKPTFDDEESVEIITENPNSKAFKNRTSSIDKIETNDKIFKVKKTKKQQPAESEEQVNDEKILSNIELPTDAPGHTSPENRKARGSNRKVERKDPEEKTKSSSRKGPAQRITPFPEDVGNQFFPYIGNYYYPGPNHPYNFDQYYQYFNPNGYPNAHRNKMPRRNQKRKNNKPNAKTHDIEVSLKPKKQQNTTETTTIPATTEILEDVEEVTVSSEVEPTTELFQRVTELPMEKPIKVTPVHEINKESASEESYETFSKLDDLHEHITPLGKEDEVPIMNNNGITQDYYPVFHDDVYYSPFIENQNLEEDDDSYLYESVIKDELKRERRKYDRYEDSRHHKGLDNPGFTTKQVRNVDAKINKIDHSEHPKHIESFSETEFENKSNDEEINPEIRRVKVPPRNTRIPIDTIETVFSGSKVAKYGIPDEKEAGLSNVKDFIENKNSADKPVYVVAKSLGRVEDYM